MREILFRGKRLDNGEWVFGDLMTKYPHHEGLTIVEHGCVYHEVDPRTVGQYTGVMDKNGVKIFEGDICRAAVYKDPITLRKSIMINSLVVFRNGEFTLDGHKRLPDGFRTLPTLDDCEVLGNIYDNPEHLEVE